MLHEHNIIDNDVHFIISDTGEINLLSDNKDSIIYIQQFLHLSESFTFEAPRYIEGHDMSLSNIVNIHFTNIDSKTKEESKDIYPVDGLKVDEQDENKIIFTCKLKDTCTRYVGLLKFSIIFECYEDDVVIYRWPTDIFSKIMIRRTNYNSESIVIEHSDIISEIQNEIKNIKSEFNNIGKSSIPDWNQNDSTAADYVKNRPFYTSDSVETVILDNLNIDCSSGQYKVPGFTISFEEGVTYTVTWDGTVYECVAYYADKDILAIGNGSLAGASGGSSEPFIITNLGSENVLLILDDAQSTHTVSLSGDIATTHTIEKKYLPIEIQRNAVDGEIYLDQDNKTYTLSDGLVFDSLLCTRVLLLGNICYINNRMDDTFIVSFCSLDYIEDSSGSRIWLAANVYLLSRDGTYTSTKKHIEVT